MILSLWANPDDGHGEDPGVDEVLDPVADGVDGEVTQTWIIVIMSDDHEFYELTLTMIMAILTHSDMNHSDHERWSCILRANPDHDHGDFNPLRHMNHSDHERWSWILWSNPDDDHGEDPGVDEVLDPVADGVDGEEAGLEIGVEVPTHSFKICSKSVGPNKQKVVVRKLCSEAIGI